jgi:hypothetical protein
MFAVALFAGKRLGHFRTSRIIKYGFMLTSLGLLLLLPIIPIASSGWLLFIPLLIVGSGLGLLVSQLNNYTLAPIAEQHVSEAAGVNSAAGSFGLSFGLAMAGGILLAALSLSFTSQTNASTIIPAQQQHQISSTLESSAQVVSNTQLQTAIVHQPQNIQTEVLAINQTATYRALQIALLIPLSAAIIGTWTAIRMDKLPDTQPSRAADSVIES